MPEELLQTSSIYDPDAETEYESPYSNKNGAAEENDNEDGDEDEDDGNEDTEGSGFAPNPVRKIPRSLEILNENSGTYVLIPAPPLDGKDMDEWRNETLHILRHQLNEAPINNTAALTQINLDPESKAALERYKAERKKLAEKQDEDEDSDNDNDNDASSNNDEDSESSEQQRWEEGAHGMRESDASLDSYERHEITFAPLSDGKDMDELRKKAHHALFRQLNEVNDAEHNTTQPLINSTIALERYKAEHKKLAEKQDKDQSSYEYEDEGSDNGALSNNDKDSEFAKQQRWKERVRGLKEGEPWPDSYEDEEEGSGNAANSPYIDDEDRYDDDYQGSGDNSEEAFASEDIIEVTTHENIHILSNNASEASIYLTNDDRAFDTDVTYPIAEIVTSVNDVSTTTILSTSASTAITTAANIATTTIASTTAIAITTVASTIASTTPTTTTATTVSSANSTEAISLSYNVSDIIITERAENITYNENKSEYKLPTDLLIYGGTGAGVALYLAAGVIFACTAPKPAVSHVSNKVANAVLNVFLWPWFGMQHLLCSTATSGNTVGVMEHASAYAAVVEIGAPLFPAGTAASSKIVPIALSSTHHLMRSAGVNHNLATAV